MKIIRALKEDHTNIRKLLRDILETEGHTMEDRKTLFVTLRAQLLAHSQAEEESLYGALEETGELRDEVMEGREEHRVTSVLLEEMSGPEIDDEHWMAKLKVVKDLMEHHLTEEEEEIFPKAKRLFEKDEAKFLGALYADARDNVISVAPRSP